MHSSFEHAGAGITRSHSIGRRPGRVAIAVATLLVSVTFASAALAAMHPNTRDGWFIGLGVGGGSAGLTGNGASSDREMGSAGSLRAGYMLNPKWAIGFESNIWFKTIDGVEWTFGTYAFGVSVFPAEGLVLRAAVGAGDAEAAFSQGSSTVTATENGFGLTAGAAYEFRIARTFALGPQVDYSLVNLDSFDVNYVNFGVQVNWYILPK